MRLWTLHPEYLDTRGLVALWREALLAQAVLRGETRGYTHHPQLMRFRESPSPLKSIACYLNAVQAEAKRRNYNFNAGKIHASGRARKIAVSRGQLYYEWAHLKAKLRVRAPSWLTKLRSVPDPKAHPLFRIVPGKIEKWEIIKERKLHRKPTKEKNR